MSTDSLTSFDEHERQIAAQLDDVETRLLNEYGHHPGGAHRVREVLAALRDHYRNARIRTFLPILIERAAREELASPA